MKTLLITIVFVVTGSNAAYAGNQIFQSQFKKLDTNTDGVLTQQEIQAQPTLVRFTNFFYQDSFLLADINKDGFIDIEEFIANEEYSF